MRRNAATSAPSTESAEHAMLGSQVVLDLYFRWTSLALS